MMDGRVKTLHPMVHGGLLSRRDNAGDTASMKEHGIVPIDLAIINLYPFEATVAKGADYEDCIENIDIGGPALIRAAAKNHAFVTVVTEAADYDALKAEMDAHDGATGFAFRKRLAAAAYARTAAYDAAISGWFAGVLGETFPKRATPSRASSHRRCATARTRTRRPRSTSTAPIRARASPPPTQIQGKELSFNNLNDTDAAFELVVRVRGAGHRHHQARQPVRRVAGRRPARRLPARAVVRSGLGVRRHHRRQPAARRRHRRGDRQAVRGSGDRPRDHRGGAEDSRQKRRTCACSRPAPWPTRRRPA